MINKKPCYYGMVREAKTKRGAKMLFSENRRTPRPSAEFKGKALPCGRYGGTPAEESLNHQIQHSYASTMHFPHHPIANSNSSTGRCCARCSSTSLDNDDTLSLPERATSTGTNRGMHSIRCTKLQELTVQGAGIDEIKAHISKCPLSPRSMDRFGRSPLFWAIKLARSDEIIRHVYLAAPDMLLSFDVYGKTCLDLLYAPRTRNARVLALCTRSVLGRLQITVALHHALVAPHLHSLVTFVAF